MDIRVRRIAKGHYIKNVPIDVNVHKPSGVEWISYKEYLDLRKRCNCFKKRHNPMINGMVQVLDKNGHIVTFV